MGLLRAAKLVYLITYGVQLEVFHQDQGGSLEFTSLETSRSGEAEEHYSNPIPTILY